jgi:hypothetical protein
VSVCAYAACCEEGAVPPPAKKQRFRKCPERRYDSSTRQTKAEHAAIDRRCMAAFVADENPEPEERTSNYPKNRKGTGQPRNFKKKRGAEPDRAQAAH